jgi:hypothetical protein
MLQNASLIQHLIASVVIAYVAFCLLYGHASLKARRSTAAAHTPTTSTTPGFGAFARNVGLLTKASLVFVIPVALLVVLLSVTGRERGGVIEASNLFSVPGRGDTAAAFVTSGDFVSKGQVVVEFASDASAHRIASLRARRQELLSTREALKSSLLPQSAEAIVRLQAQEQRLAQLDQTLTEVERTSFSANQQLVATHAAWQRSRSELVARLPGLEQSLASEKAEHETAGRALARIRRLRENGFATLSQLDRVSIAETIAKHRANATREALVSTREAIATLDDGYHRTRSLLDSQIAKLGDEAKALERRRAPVVRAIEEMNPVIAINEATARTRRSHEIAAANARIEELDNEIAAVVAQTHVKSPIDGRVLYRNATSSTLAGSAPLLVVASSQGFLMRVDLSRDEVPALESGRETGREFDVLVDDASARRLVPAKLVRIDDNGFDPKRVTAVFGVEMPEDMLVRMALKGTSPRGYLRWSPPVYAVVTEKIAQVLRFNSPSTAIVRTRVREESAVPARIPIGTRKAAAAPAVEL